MTADFRYWADWFWKLAGGRSQYPADIGYAASCALAVAVHAAPGLTIRAAVACLPRFGVSLPNQLPSADRPLCGYIAVGQAGAIILVDGDDSEDERRFTVAHEMSHYILEVHTHRVRAERMMDRNYLAVLYGSREPTNDERLDAWLKRVRTTPFAHLMDRAPDGGHGCGQTLSAECDADALAVEILAPRSEMVGVVRANRHLPFRRAVDEAALAARRIHGPAFEVQDRLHHRTLRVGAPYSQSSSSGYDESCSWPSAVISTCSSSLIDSRPPTVEVSASTQNTIPSCSTPSSPGSQSSG